MDRHCTLFYFSVDLQSTFNKTPSLAMERLRSISTLAQASSNACAIRSTEDHGWMKRETNLIFHLTKVVHLLFELKWRMRGSERM